MKKRYVFLYLIFAAMQWSLHAQNAAPAESTLNEPTLDRAHAQDWSSDIVTGWRVRPGDDPAWASPGFDDSAWETVRLDDLGSSKAGWAPGDSKAGWRWFRLHLKLSENHPDLSLLVDASEGAYQLFVNGAKVPGPEIRSSFRVSRPTERTFAIAAPGPDAPGPDSPGQDIEIALRTFTPPSYRAWHMPLFLTVSLGTPDAIDNERQSLESSRLYSVIPSIAINLMLILAGIAAFGLYRSQPRHREYLWLGMYLFLDGMAYLLSGCQQVGILPLSANFLLSDLLLYLVAIAQIEFTFSFGGLRVGRVWRLYEVLLLAPLPLTWLTWLGLFSSDTYVVIEALILVPVAILLPILLFVWYRRGNREAGWLILPSLLPAAAVSVFDLGTLSIFFGWGRLDFLDNPIQFGSVPVQSGDACDLLFLLAISIVMFFRFTRVNREQARAAAEFEAAREVQQLLVAPAVDLPGFQIQSAYLPAKQVGGDFFRVLPAADGSVFIVTGDVSGKGLKAAMTVSAIMGALRGCDSRKPGEVLDYLNRVLFGQVSGFVTCTAALIAADGEMTLANAGNPAPYCNGEEMSVEAGLPLGILAEAEYKETGLQLSHNHQLTFVSDGVVEATNPQGELYGFDRTQAISNQSAHAIAQAALQFGQEDDITVLTVMRVADSEALTA